MNNPTSPGPDAPGTVAAPRDDIAVRRWFFFYAIFFAATCAVIYYRLHDSQAWDSWVHLVTDWTLGRWFHHLKEWGQQVFEAFKQTPASVKVLVTLAYLSLCTTVLPLPTGWIIAGMATQEAAVASNVWEVTLIVALAGAVGSTIANLNDYHIFTLLLRSRRVAKIRDTRMYHAAAKWFEKAPFFLLTLFSILPLPVDVIRLLAITYRYGRHKFALANFLGRFIRYAVFAFVTYQFNLGWVAVVALLGLAVVMALGKGVQAVWRKYFTRTNPNAA